MNIRGAEGLSPENIRDEMKRGARVVVFTYCVSLLVITFKRGSGLRFIKPGQSAAMAGLPYTLLSLVAGWWGFPWGPIYTIETIYRNVGGGIDVTDDVLRQLLPSAPRVVAEVKASESATVPMAPAAGAAKPRGLNYRAIGLMAGAAAVIAVVGTTGYCLYQQQNLTVVVCSGIDQPYAVQLNGEVHQLGAHGVETLQLAEGVFTLEDAAGSHVVGTPQTFEFRLPLLDHLGTKRVLVINPDRAAVLVREEIPYYSDGTTPPANEAGQFSILANQGTHFIERPDYVIEPAEERINMPSGTSRVVKSRLDYLHGQEPPARVAALLVNKLGYDGARVHLMTLGRYRADEDLLYAAVSTLKPEDMPAFFRQRLADRPVLLEWHRYYQQMMEATQPDWDLAGEYRRYAEAEPENGALQYLFGRTVVDFATAQQCWQRALNAPQPCAYAHMALGYDALSLAQFEEAWQHIVAGGEAKLQSRSQTRYRRDAMWALNRYEELAKELADARKAEPLDLELVGEQITVVLAAQRPAVEVEQLKTALLKQMKAADATPETLADCSAYLDAVVAYHAEDLPTYASLVSRFKAPFYQFRAAVARSDLEAAAKAAAAQERPGVTEHLLLYLLARQSGQDETADQHFANAVAAMKNGSPEFRSLAGMLANEAQDPTAICHLRFSTEDKCVLLATMGLRDPVHRTTYHELARKLNFRPGFPQHLLRQVLKPAETRAAGAAL
ncbi:tetratricopeptide repeat protein [Opitutus terrae]|uniref:Uncharacterized protein n=1 Tax=Opitutus terrae (strain DSM 11246 / JCM 15787 / PB90-1) TaxID=452637 RepID=B1ZNW2_OPITP|nr:hypothetical protein [Opitutus terrae]ACB75482.1 hypothetical protein Oter_2199 [Opitutus terrae PB90-1]